MIMMRLHKAIGDILFSKIYKRYGFLKTYSLVSREVTIILLARTVVKLLDCSGNPSTLVSKMQ